MSISEQIKELRDKADVFERSGCAVDGIVKAFREAADTIEFLSAKLADIEQSVEDCSGWIYCGDGKNLPEEHDSMFAKLKGTEKWDSAMFEKISDDVNVTVEFENGERKTKTLHTVDGKWNGGQRGVKFKVIAWQPLPEPYRQ